MDLSLNSFLAWLDQKFQSRQNNPNPPYPYDREANTIDLPEEIEGEIISLLRSGSKAKAVKYVAILTGAGLRVSKDYVDHLLHRL